MSLQSIEKRTAMQIIEYLPHHSQAFILITSLTWSEKVIQKQNWIKLFFG